MFPSMLLPSDIVSRNLFNLLVNAAVRQAHAPYVTWFAGGVMLWILHCP